MTEYKLPAPELVYFSSIFGLVAFFINTRKVKQDVLTAVPADMRTVLFLRVLCGCLQDTLLYVAFMYTNYSKAYCIFFLNTIMIPFFASYFIKEPISKFDILGIVVGFTGMLLIIQPWKFAETDGDSVSHESKMMDLVGIGIAIGSAVTGALAIVCIRLMSCSFHYSVCGFYFNFGNLILSPIQSALIGKAAEPA